MRSIRRVSALLTNCGVWFGGVCLVAMMILTFAEIVGRLLGQHPVKGSFETIGQLLVPVASFGMAYTQSKRGHIDIDLLTKRFPQRAQVTVELIGYSLCLVTFSLLTWQVFVLGTVYWDKGLISQTLGFPLAPFVYLAGVACAVMCVELLTELIELLIRLRRK